MKGRCTQSLLCVVLVVSLLCGALPQTAGAAANEVTVTYNGVRLDFDVPAQLVGGRVMVPLRAIFEAMGATVEWDAGTQTATAIREDTTVVITVGSLRPTINGVVVLLDVPAQIVGGRTLAPLRFVGEAFGGYVSWNAATRVAAITTDKTTAELAGIAKRPVDLAVASGDISWSVPSSGAPDVVNPGARLTLRAKVVNKSDHGTGGTVAFSVAGTLIDTVPFYIEGAGQSTQVETGYALPLDDFRALAPGSRTSVGVQVQVSPDDMGRETHTGDNSASRSMQVQGVKLETKPPAADAVIDACRMLDGTGLPASVAIPGTWATFQLTVSASQGGHARAVCSVDGSTIDDVLLSISKPGGTDTESFRFFVPWSAQGSLNVRVALSSGATFAQSVPVEPLDLVVRNQGISWDTPDTPTEGKTVTIRCKVFKDSQTPFSKVRDKLPLVFVVNGVPSEPVRWGSVVSAPPSMDEYTYAYRIPKNCVWPLAVKVAVDACGLFNEPREGNNIAVASIPSKPVGSTRANLSVGAADLWYYPTTLVPGEKVQLFAAVKNGSVSSKTAGTTVAFAADGVPIDPGNAVYRSTIGGGQYRVFSEVWTVPAGAVADPVFTVALTLPASLAADSKTDNQARVTLPLARPDLAVASVNATAAGGMLASSNQAELTAEVQNLGPAPASGVAVEFLLDGTSVASRRVELAGRAACTLTVSCTLPRVVDASPAADITGVSGYATAAGKGSITVSATVDPLNQVAESNERNNTAGPRTFEVKTTSAWGMVRVQVRDMDFDGMAGVSVAIAASGKTASAVTDARGWCTFLGVPYGPYEVTAAAAGYNAARTYDRVLYADYRTDHVELVLDNMALVSGTITSGGTTLAGVTVEVQGASTTTDGSGRFSLKLPAGTWTVRFRKVGYARHDEQVTLAPAAQTTVNLSMDTTTLGWAYGQVTGMQDEPLAGMQVEAVRGETVLAQTTTGAEGMFELAVPLDRLVAEDISLRITGHGLAKNQAATLRQGLESRCNIEFRPAPEVTETTASAGCRITPWTECASIPDTFFTEGYEVKAVYGLFDLQTSVRLENAVLQELTLATTPDFWMNSGVKSGWSPLELLKATKDAEAAVDFATFLLPLDVPLAVTYHSTNHTRVWVKKVAVLSGGAEVFGVYPDVMGSFTCAPGTEVDWDNCRVKFYLKVEPDNGVPNPAAGYGFDRVLVEWDPKSLKFTLKGHYLVTGWDEGAGHELYLDLP